MDYIKLSVFNARFQVETGKGSKESKRFPPDGGLDGGLAHKLNDPKEIYFSEEFHNHNILSE